MYILFELLIVYKYSSLPYQSNSISFLRILLRLPYFNSFLNKMKPYLLPFSFLLLPSPLFAQVTYPNSSQTILRTDPGAYGPELEEYHYYYDQWPIGLAISSTGRFFASYTRGNYSFTVGEAVNKTAEIPYPSAGLNLPPSQLNTSWNGIPFGSNNSTGLISVQALYITPQTPSRPETLWLVDTGRPTIMDGQGVSSMPYAQPGGPKIVGVSLKNDSVYATYTFPASVHFPDSYMNDIRFDLRGNISFGGEGVAYIVSYISSSDHPSHVYQSL
jgi:hypothetical protein